MKILKEGTIKVLPDLSVEVTDFHVSGGTLGDLQAVVEDRVLQTARLLILRKAHRGLTE